MLPQRFFAIGRNLKILVVGMVANVLGYSLEVGLGVKSRRGISVGYWDRRHPAREKVMARMACHKERRATGILPVQETWPRRPWHNWLRYSVHSMPRCTRNKRAYLRIAEIIRKYMSLKLNELVNS